MAAPSLLQTLPAMARPADLQHATLLRTPLEPWAPWFAAANLPWPEPTHGPKLVDLGMTLEAAACGQGIALGRPSLARPWLTAGSLVPLFKIQAQPGTHYHLLPYSGELAQLFVNWLRAICADVELQSQALLSASSGTFVRRD
jgi:LysR family transcriptional regulator, glycine cleavage system transcriptional activator